MEQVTNPARKSRSLGTSSLSAAALFAVVLGGTAFADTGADSSLNAASAASAAGFEARFEPFETLPAAPETPAHAVDITDIDPPVEPETSTVRSLGAGVASYYGKRFNGRPTASGERFDMNALTGAHKTLPFGTKVRVTNARTGKSVVVRINDRGPFTPGRMIDVSHAAATQIGLIQAGHAKVTLEVVS